MDLSPDRVLGGGVAAWLLLVGGLAAVTASTAIEEDDRDQLAPRVAGTIRVTHLALGLPLVAGLCWLFLAETKPGSGGIMSPELARGLGSCVVFVLSAGAVIVGALLTTGLGYVGCALAKGRSAAATGLIVFGVITGGVPLAVAAYWLQMRAQR